MCVCVVCVWVCVCVCVHTCVHVCVTAFYNLGSSLTCSTPRRWTLVWTTIHSGSRRFGEAEKPGPVNPTVEAPLLRWLQANITGACNLACVLELGADITLLVDPGAQGGILASECKRRELVCTSRGQANDLLAAIVFDTRMACELEPDLGRWPQWQSRVAGIRIQLGARLAGVAWVIYGLDRPSAGGLAELQAVLQSFTTQAKAFGDVPVLLAGDFNAVLDDCALRRNRGKAAGLS
jgi:hypothetical protein